MVQVDPAISVTDETLGETHRTYSTRIPRSLLFAYALYAAAYIGRTSFVIQGTRYFSLFDDAMVSMRYAKHIARGMGAVWNVNGPRVEGYTNPLWVLYMAAVHLLPVPPHFASLLIEISGALSVGVTMCVVWQLTSNLSHGSQSAAFAAAILTGFYLPLNTWALQGLEVGILALLVITGCWIACDSLRSSVFASTLYLVMATATLIRPDGVAPYVALWLALVVIDAPHRQRHVMIGAAILCVSIGAQTAFRWWYFGNLLPNTYYLKVTGFPIALRIGRGLIVFLTFLWHSSPVILVFAVTFGVYRDRAIQLIIVVAASIAVYSVFVGGDAWEWWGGANRYLSVAMPIVFVVLGVGLHELYVRVTHASPDRSRFHRGAFAVIALIGLANLNMFRGRDSLLEAALLIKPLSRTGNEVMVRRALEISEITDADARVSVVWAGALPYFTEREYIDLLGKTDPVIAHEPMHLAAVGSDRFTAFYPGHLKWDYNYSLGKLKPDVIVDLWADPDGAIPLVRHDYILWHSQVGPLFLRRSSAHIRWDVVRQGGHLESVTDNSVRDAALWRG